jgi:hypothetical protein
MTAKTPTPNGGPTPTPDLTERHPAPTACCSPVEQTTCCEPAAKGACCGPAATTGGLRLPLNVASIILKP